MKVLSYFLFLILNSAFAGQAPDFTVSINQSAKETTITALPPAAHHFNIKAPMKLEESAQKKIYKPKLASPNEIRFLIRKKELPASQLTLYLCDDANTYCEKKTLNFGSPTGSSGPETPKKAKASVDHFGFIVNNPEAAFEKALKEQKPLLIDFFAIWCPPCNQLDEQVFVTSEFKKTSTDFIKLKIDADAPEFANWKTKYNIVGYPTVVFATPQGEELSRFLGFRPLEDFTKELKASSENKNLSYAQLTDEKLGFIYLGKREFEPAQKHLKKAVAKNPSNKDLQRNLREAELGALQDAGKEKEHSALLKKTAEEYPNTILELESRMELQQWDRAIEIAKNRIQELQKISSKKPVLDSGYSIADFWQIIAQGHENLGHKDSQKEAYKTAAKYYRERLDQLPKKEMNRGINLELAGCLWRSGDFKSAEKIYNTLRKKYPKEFTFHFAHARMAFEKKETERAEKLASSALEFSYGDNKLRAAELLAKILAAQGKTRQGLELVRNTLQTTPVPENKKLGTFRMINKLKDLEKKLNEQKTS